VTATVLTDSRDATEQVFLVGSVGAREETIDALCAEELEVIVTDSIEMLAERLSQTGPSIVIVMGEALLTSSSSTLRIVHEHAPDARVVFVCDSIERCEVRGALCAGAAGVVYSSQVSTALAPCLQAVRAGQVCVPHDSRRLVERPVLSAREKQILGLVVMGYMNSQIAAQLFLAESTVKSHLSSVFFKLGVRSRHEAVDLILDPDHGLDLGILALGGEPVVNPRRRVSA